MMTQLGLKNFLLNEENEYFGHRVGAVLNAVQDLSGESPQMGTRHLTRLVLTVVNQIRQILRNEWSMRQREHMERLQKVGVALMKAIDEKGDLGQTLKASGDELQQVMQDLGVPMNQLGSDLVNTPGR